MGGLTEEGEGQQVQQIKQHQLYPHPQRIPNMTFPEVPSVHSRCFVFRSTPYCWQSATPRSAGQRMMCPPQSHPRCTTSAWTSRVGRWGCCATSPGTTSTSGFSPLRWACSSLTSSISWTGRNHIFIANDFISAEASWFPPQTNHGSGIPPPNQWNRCEAPICIPLYFYLKDTQCQCQTGTGELHGESRIPVDRHSRRVCPHHFPIKFSPSLGKATNKLILGLWTMQQFFVIRNDPAPPFGVVFPKNHPYVRLQASLKCGWVGVGQSPKN